MRDKLTEKEEELLEFIVKYRDERGVQPSQREMAKRLDCNVKTIGERIEAIEKKGVIKRTGQHRHIQILWDRGTPSFLRSPQSTNLSETLDTIGVIQPKKFLIMLEADELLEKWMAKFENSKDIPIPVPIERIAKEFFHYEIRPEYLEDGVSGKSFDKEKIILVNLEDIPQRQRFTIGHELAHLYLHKRPDATSDLPLRELEANYFARCLLMPSSPFFQFVKKCFNEMKSLGEENLINEVSKKFYVSKEAAKIRLLEFDYLPIQI